VILARIASGNLAVHLYDDKSLDHSCIGLFDNRRGRTMLSRDSSLGLPFLNFELTIFEHLAAQSLLLRQHIFDGYSWGTNTSHLEAIPMDF